MGKSAPEAPKAPDYAAANREGIYADIETLPIRRMIEAASGAGKKVRYSDPATGKTVIADFTGLGDVDKARMLVQMANETAGLSAQSQLDVAKRYGTQFQDLAIEALKRQDPEGYAGRQELARGLRSDYSSQNFPTESSESQLLRDAAVAQSLRGGPTGSGYSALDTLMRQTGISQAGAGAGQFCWICCDSTG